MWGGEFGYLLVLGFVGLPIGLVGWTAVLVTTPEKPRERVRRMCSLGFALGGYFIAGVAGLVDWWAHSQIPSPAWPLVGLIGGCILGYVSGIGVGVWLGTEAEEE